MNIEIRNECVTDFAKIAEITADAFEINFLDNDNPAWFLSELTLIDSLRRYGEYDNDLSLVAVCDGETAGYVGFTPVKVNLYGEAVRGVCLAPVSVASAYQRKGIGAALIKEGLKRAGEKDYAFSYLLGHESYYPKLGYITGMFGEASVTITERCKAFSLSEKQVEELHLSLIEEWYRRIFADINLSIMPLFTIVEWKSVSPFVKTSMIYKEENPVGYIRYCEFADGTVSVKSILSRNESSMREIIGYVQSKYPKLEKLSLPLPPDSEIINGIGCIRKSELWDAAMIKIIDNNCKPLLRYVDDIRNGIKNSWFANYPSFFDYI